MSVLQARDLYRFFHTETDEVIALALEEAPPATAVTVEATAPLWTTEPPPQGLQTPAEQ